jgi:hypothetical protein
MPAARDKPGVASFLKPLLIPAVTFCLLVTWMAPTLYVGVSEANRKLI